MCIDKLYLMFKIAFHYWDAAWQATGLSDLNETAVLTKYFQFLTVTHVQITIHDVMLNCLC